MHCLFFGSAPPSAGVYLSLSFSVFRCVYPPCVCARAYQRPFSLFWEPRWFRSDTAQPERTLARRSALPGRLRYPAPLHLCFFLPLFPPLSTATPFIPTHTAQIYTHTYIYIYTKRNTQSRLCPLEANISFQLTLADLLALVCDLQSNSMVMNITNTTNTRGCLKDVYKVYVKNSFS